MSDNNYEPHLWKLKVVGVQETKYVDTRLDGHNCNFTETPTEFTKHIIYCKSLVFKNSYAAIELYEREHECSSGWTSARTAYRDIKYNIDTIGPFTHIPKKPIEIEINTNEECHDESTSVYTYSEYGCGDEWYPTGSYQINMDLFEKTPRYKDKRVVYIFKGQSGVGKSYIASNLSNMDIYETDSSDKLPDNIYANVVVLGNKYDYTIDDVKHRLFGEVNVVVCTMEHT